MAATCTLIGKIVGANGQPMQTIAVRARPVSQRNATIVVDDAIVSEAAIETQTDVNGGFSLTLVRGLQVVVTCDVIGFSKQVTIPDAASVDLKDL